LSKKPELGGAVISARTEVHYLEFTMAASVQGWKKNWFYIKDQKNSSSDQYGIAPFDANQDLKKLSLWDSPPMEAEMEVIKPLLTRIQALKSGSGGRAVRDSADVVLSATVSPASSASRFQTLVIFWLERFFSSI
jgi:hypothetical protein